MNRTRIIAAAITAAIAIALVVVLLLCRLVFDPTSLRQPPRPTTELVEVDEEFVDLLDQAAVPSDPSPAYSSEEMSHDSHAADASGDDLADAGDAGLRTPDVVSERQSPLQRKKSDPVKTGSSKAETEAEARRRARQGVSDAFASAPESQDNTEKNKPAAEQGDTGKPTGAESALDGTGTGTVGGGWIMPRYAKVNSTVTGRIELRAIVGKDGRVVKVEQTGGKAPAAANSGLVAKCIAEVKSRRFTRTDDDAPDQAVATIIYTFK